MHSRAARAISIALMSLRISTIDTQHRNALLLEKKGILSPSPMIFPHFVPFFWKWAAISKVFSMFGQSPISTSMTIGSTQYAKLNKLVMPNKLWECQSTCQKNSNEKIPTENMQFDIELELFIRWQPSLSNLTGLHQYLQWL